MKIILHVAITPNGFIAKQNDNTSYISDEYLDVSLWPLIERSGNLIIGRKTYQIMQRDGDMEGMDKIRIIILTSKNEIELISSHHSIAHSPTEAVEILSKENCKEILVAGGAKTFSAFIEKKLIDEIIIDVLPIIFADGIAMLTPQAPQLSLTLLNTEKITDGILRISYAVQKS